MRKVIFWLYPHLQLWNGGSRYILEVSKFLSRKYEVHLLISTGNKQIISAFEKEKIFVHTLGFSDTSNVLYWLFFPLVLLWEITRYKALEMKFKPCVVLSTLFPSNFFASLINHASHIQICWEPFAYFYDKELLKSLAFPKNFAARILSKIYSPLDIWSVKRASYVLSLNKATGKWISKIYARKPNGSTYMGVNFSHFKKKRILTQFKKNRPMLFHSTDFTALKGTQEVLHALAFVKKRVPDVIMYISSPNMISPEANKIVHFVKRAHLARSVKFVGTISYNMLPSYYSAADAFIFAGIGDTGAGAAASLSVLESLACGTPVVRSFYTNEEVIDGKTGFLVNPRNIQKMANVCIRLLSNKELNHKMSVNTRKSIFQKYQWSQTASIIDTFIQKVIYA